MQQQHNNKLRFVALALALLVLFVQAQSDENDRVTSLPGYGEIPQDAKQYAGFLSAKDAPNTSTLFYWLFEHAQDNAPLILWLNGGPGCSSVATGLFRELGPFRVGDGQQLVPNPDSWLKAGHLLFIDQPVGVGFSFAASDDDLAKDQQNVADDMHRALLKFFAKFPKFKNNAFYISGESYAGKYIPSIASKILEVNSQGVAETYINLKGVAIGDGLVDGLIQRNVILEQAYYAGLLSYDQKEQVAVLAAKCTQQIQQGNFKEEGGPCDAMLHDFLGQASGFINMYDYRSFSRAADEVNVYLNRTDVQDAIHVTRERGQVDFVGCSGRVYEALASDILISLKYTVKSLAEQLPVLLYNGNFDLQDGAVGTEQYLVSMNIAGFNTAPRNLWINQDKVAGYVKASGNLTFVTVFGSGHFVPADQPANSLDMIQRFVNSQPFCDSTNKVKVQKKFVYPHLLKSNSAEADEIVNVDCNVAQTICTTALNNCFGNGNCVQGQCICKEGFVGKACAYPKTTLMFMTMDDAVTDSQAKLSSQDWYYYDMMMMMMSPSNDMDMAMPLTIRASAKIVKPASKIDTLPMQDKFIGEGLGGVQPFNKFCLYGKKKDIPTVVSYDFVRCTNEIDDKTGITELVAVHISDMGDWYFGVLNTFTNTDVSFTLIADPNDSSDGPSNPWSFLAAAWQFWVVIGAVVLVMGVPLILSLVALRIALARRPHYTEVN